MAADIMRPAAPIWLANGDAYEERTCGRALFES